MAFKRCSVYGIPALLCCCLCFFNSITCFQNETDRLALISFKLAIKQDPFQIFSSWNNSLHFCQWYGVSCSRRHPHRVAALNLRSQGLVGSLSPHIGNLSFLRLIDLENNSFHGEIPQQIGNLRRAQGIYFSNNSFQGNIPTNLSHCSKLMYLNLIDNKLVGNIPVELGSLPKLEALGLAKNFLTGSIPPSIGNLSSLWQISLRRNRLHGKIPEEISRLCNLMILNFAENNLIGQIPSGLFNVSNLEIFEVNDNQLNGSIPSDIGFTLPKLSSLAVSVNRFTGLVPISLSNASALEQISFEYNGFSGLVPKDFGKLPFLQFVNFALNYLEGDLSFIDSLTNCSSLNLVNVRKNFLKGTAPISIANLSKELYFLSVADNQLHNVIPLGIENLINLRLFLFGCNYFSGPLLIDFGKFQLLQMLDLGSNKFTGTIPSSIGNLSLLSHVFLGFNNLHGSIPPSLGNCRHLIELELVHNNLTGSIPKEVIGIPSLSISLDLSANSLSGSIPSEVGLLQNLVRLDLSDNKLSEYLHNGSSSTIIHGDLKPSNVLLDEAMTAYIGDFGLAKIISTISDEVQPYQSSSSTAIKGSIGYVAPDYGMGGRISIKGDVYSFGILLLEMFTGKRPTDDTFQDDLNLRIFVERSLSYRAMEIVDPRILSEEGRESIEEGIIISILKIGVACSMEQPGERIEMQSAISELQKIKGNYLKRKLKQERRNAYQIGGPSTSHY
ncbi:hypothetical protein JCGZ_08922 [Jatropha curcas]|uniref:non-specific serine/threonine protein kinase n=1 Tax=Jatropha curcas TaxID=180498 RepID=A0A067LQR2_JATCU|nr:hypothetical protein JCGZ_08922 [Jatropha curcas]